MNKNSYMKKLTKNDFILKCRCVHGWKYDYSKVEYVNNNTKVCIICPEHGEFWQTPANHLRGQACPKCKSVKLSKLFSDNVETFIKKAKKIHNNKYDYNEVEYFNNRTKVKIICPIHGCFEQTPDKHLSGNGCPKCCKKNRKYTTTEFIDKSKTIHGDKYDYSKVVYGNNKKDKVCIVCPIHGEFWQSPGAHLNGCGCRYCKKGDMFNLSDFLEKAKIIHENKYDYSKVKYVNSTTPVCIVCDKHGEFYQKPVNHILKKEGCPLCNKNGRQKETQLFDFLCKKLQGVKVIQSYRNKNVLGKQEIDIFLPEYKIGVEFQGEQHFEAVDFGGYGIEKANKLLLENQERDKKKLNKCLKSGIKLFYFSNLGYNVFLGEKIYHDENELLLEITKTIKNEKQ